MSRSRHTRYYLDTVLKSLILDYHISKERAEKLISKSTFSELLAKDLNYVGHYPPEFWAENIINESQYMPS